MRKPAEDLLKACEELPGFTSVLAAIAGAHAANPDARAGAVILLKNIVRVRWRSRGGRGYVVRDEEKAALRGFLLAAGSMEEPSDKVASQVSCVRCDCVTVCAYGVLLFRWSICLSAVFRVFLILSPFDMSRSATVVDVEYHTIILS